MISNHTSWLDITVISTLAPVSFIAKREVASWPLFGTFARLQRSIFIDRTRRKGAAEANREIAERLAGGDAIILFAEGTTSDGNRVLPFRSSLVGAARDAVAEAGHTGHVLVQTLTVAYVRAQRPADRTARAAGHRLVRRHGPHAPPRVPPDGRPSRRRLRLGRADGAGRGFGPQGRHARRRERGAARPIGGCSTGRG